MSERPARSLRTRLLALLATLVLLGTGLQLAGAFRAAIAEADDLFDYHMRQIALSLRDAGVAAVRPSPFGAPADFDFVVQVWSRDGVRVYQSHRHAWLPDQAVLGFAQVRAPDGDWRTFAVQSPDAIVQVAQNLAVRQRLALRYAARSLWPTLLFGVLLLGGVWWVVTSSLAPLERARGELARRDAASLAPLDARGLPAELGPLVGEINALMQRLREALDARQRFVADAAHELRTPLTALKLQLQMLERAGDAAGRERAQARLRDGVERATRLVGQLLGLERAQSGGDGAGSACAADAAREVAELLRDAAAARGTTIELALDDDAPVTAPREALETLLRNLVDNALRYAPPGSRVRIGVRRSGDAIELCVEDDGPGIPEEERTRVFDRFYRRPGQAAEGSGLGLAIVREIAERAGGRVALETSRLGGLAVQVRLPAA